MRGIDIGRKLTLEEVDLLRSRGYRFAARYLDGSKGSSAKAIDTAEAAYLLSRGFGIVLVFQTSANYAGYFTYAQGLADGQAARADALALGAPLGMPICFAVDVDVTDPDAQLLDYVNGVFTGLDGAYQLGVYGEHAVVKHADENWPAVAYLWQTYAWSGGVYYVPSDVYQHANGVEVRPGLIVDENKATTLPVWRLAS